MGYLGDAFSVVLADDQRFFREGLRATLESDGVRVLGEAADGLDAVALARLHTPDVLVMDLDLAGCSGIETVRRIATVAPEIRVVVLTVSTVEEDVLAALAAGACGYLLKDASVTSLAGAIRQAAEGLMVLAHDAGGRLLAHVRAGTGGEQVEGHASLTPRETEVLRLIADGADNVSIGYELSISPHTVKQYVTNIFEKLGVRSRVQAAVHAVRVGLV